jgi:two-component system, LuxR family, secretion system response regulator SsrB
MSEAQQWLTESTTCDETPVPSTRTLTAKQRAVIRLVSLGCSSTEAGQILRISKSTAENHKNRAMDRLGIHKAALLTRFAIENGIAPVGDSLTEDERHGLSLSPTLCEEIRLHSDCDSRENNNRATG